MSNVMSDGTAPTTSAASVGMTSATAIKTSNVPMSRSI